MVYLTMTLSITTFRLLFCCCIILRMQHPPGYAWRWQWWGLKPSVIVLWHEIDVFANSIVLTRRKSWKEHKTFKGCCSLHSLWQQTKRGSQFSWGCFIRFANYEKIAMVTHHGRRKCGKFRQRKMFALRRFFLLAKCGGGNLNDLP